MKHFKASKNLGFHNTQKISLRTAALFPKEQMKGLYN
jgi:hypothetical protein